MADLQLDRSLSFVDAAQSGIRALGQLAGMADRDLRQKADADLYYIRAQFESDFNTQMKSLGERNDWQNLPAEFEKFMSDQSTKLKDQSRNGYMTRQIDRMITGYALSGMQRIEGMVSGLKREDILLTDERGRNLVRENNTGQARIDKTSESFDREYAQGLISREVYEESLLKEAGDTYADYLYTAGIDAVKNAITEGKGFDAVASALEADGTAFSVRMLHSSSANGETLESGKAQYTDISNAVDRDGIRQGVLAKLEDRYDGMVADLQAQNANFCSEYNRQIFDNRSIEEQISMCEEGIAMLGTEGFSGYRMSEDDRNKYVRMWTAYMDELKKARGKGVTGRSGSGGGSLSSFLTNAAVKTMPGNLLREVLNGTFTDFYSAKEAYTDRLYEIFMSGEWKETAGMTPEEKERWFAENMSSHPELQLLDNDVLREVLENEPRYESIKNAYNAAMKDIVKNGENYTPEAARILSSFIIDLVASTGGNVTDETLKELENKINAVTLAGVKGSFRRKTLLGYKDFGTDEKGIAQAAQSLSQNDLVFTDTRGNVVWTSQEAREQAEKNARNMAEVVGNVLGVDPADVGIDFRRTETDITNEPVFTVDGDKYEIRAVEDGDGKAEHFVITKNGEEFYDSAGQGMPMSAKEKAREQSEEAKEASEATKNARYRAMAEEAEKTETVPPEVEEMGITQEEWTRADRAQRLAWMGM